MNIANLLVRAGRVHGGHLAVALGNRPWATYGDLAHRVACLAGNLRNSLGLDAGDRVALVMKNVPAYVEVMFACWHAGLVAVPVNAKLHPREFAFILKHAGARACFVTADLAGTIAALAHQIDDLDTVIAVEDDAYAALGAGDPMPIADRAPEDTAWLFYTSGTTGRPKGAMLSHRNLLVMTTSYFADVDVIFPGDAILHAAPMSHGSCMYMIPHVAAAACQVIPGSGGFDPAEVFASIAAHPRIAFFAAPTMVHRLVNSPEASTADLANLKTIVYGGGPMYAADCKAAMAVLGNRLAQIYGQGESPMTITALSKAHHADTAHPRYEQRLASVGVADTVVEVRVADADNTPVAPGEAGEVLVRGDAVMTGYWRDEKATAETLRGGWLHTGDVGALDADGFLTLMDRSKDLIIAGGSNIYPREVEEVLAGHPSVAEVSVIGAPDPEWGEVVCAFVVPVPGEALDVSALDALCLDHLARFKRPKRYRAIDALPKNNYGKVLKTELRSLLAEEGEPGS